MATLALTTTLAGSLVLAAGAAQAADTAPSRSKAAIEHEERAAAGSGAAGPTKAQIEHSEADAITEPTRSIGSSTTGQSAATGGDAAAWQLATAAALGALVTGAAFVGARQVAAHRPSGHAVAR